ncbi:MAG: pilus assembly protein N-terminal domain-containing protein [Armatimonadota bacterium]|nr:MAG: pilus assembly protein N-terminal domain-containing protein [Armatimonadota bacterium]
MKTRPHIAQQLARRAVLALMMTVLLVALAGSGWGQQVSADPAVEKPMMLGASEVLDFQGIKRAAVADPAIADYVVLSAKQIMVTARMAGATDLYVWDEKGQHTFRLVVTGVPSVMPEVVAKIRDTIAHPGITVSEHNGVILLDGEVETAYAAQRAEAIASAYAPKVQNLIQVRIKPEKPPLDIEQIQSAVGPDVTVYALTDSTLMFEGTATPEQKKRMEQIIKVLGTQVAVVDMVSAPAYEPRQILVHVKVVDVDKSALSDIGIDWGGLTSSSAEGGITQYLGKDQPILFGEVFSGPVALADGGPIRRLEGISARLKALVTDNKARVLAEPNLLVAEGETADMLVGGEIPIPVVQSTTGAATSAAGAVTVEWKEFGVRLEITGNIGANGKSIDLEVTPEVSSLDFGNAIVVSNILLPALRTRRAHSVVHIGDGQTLVIGGLYQSELSESVRKIPLLGDIPIIGELFKRTDKQLRETELVILVTPEIVTESSAAARTESALEKIGEIQ